MESTRRAGRLLCSAAMLVATVMWASEPAGAKADHVTASVKQAMSQGYNTLDDGSSVYYAAMTATFDQEQLLIGGPIVVFDRYDSEGATLYAADARDISFDVGPRLATFGATATVDLYQSPAGSWGPGEADTLVATDVEVAILSTALTAPHRYRLGGREVDEGGTSTWMSVGYSRTASTTVTISGIGTWTVAEGDTGFDEMAQQTSSYNVTTR